MVRGIAGAKVKKNASKTRMERDIRLHKDIKEAYFQGGKAIGEMVKKRSKQR